MNKTDEVISPYAFRDSPLDFMNTPGQDGEAGTDRGRTYIYDKDTDWRYSYFSCEFADGWVPGEDSDYCHKNTR